MTQKESIIEKLKKLHRMSKSAKDIGNEEEAQAFAGMVQTLLARHKIDMTDVEWEEHQREVFVRVVVCASDRRTRRQSWEDLLLGHVAYASGVQPIIADKLALFWYCGIRVDAEAARDAYEYLMAAALHLGEREYILFFHRMKRLGMVQEARGYKNSWLLGFVHRLAKRYEENEAALAAQFSSTSLVRVTGQVARIRKALMETGGVEETQVKVNHKIDNNQGFMDGMAAANRITLQNDPKAPERQLQK